MTWWAYGVHLSGPALAALPAPPAVPPPAAPRGGLVASLHAVPAPDSPPYWSVYEGDALRVGWAGEAEYEFTDGAVACRTVVETPAHAALGLLLSALPLALPRYGLEAFHGCVVARDGVAATVVGDSGLGKSTLAAALGARGWAVLSDDACAVDADGLAWPGPPLLASRTGAPAGTEVVGTYDGKTVVRAPAHPGPSPVRLGAVLLLDPREDAPLAATPLPPKEALVELLGHARAPRSLPEVRGPLRVRVAAALSALPVLLLTHVRGRDTPADVAAFADGALTRSL